MGYEYRVVTFRQGVISKVFNCSECGQDFDDYQTATQDARKHVKQTGHEVTGETTTAFVYEARIA